MGLWDRQVDAVEESLVTAQLSYRGQSTFLLWAFVLHLLPMARAKIVSGPSARQNDSELNSSPLPSPWTRVTDM